MTTPPDSCHHSQHQSHRRAHVPHSADGGTHGHVEPDPGPLGLHPAEESCSEENLQVVPLLLGFNVSRPAQLAAQHAPQLHWDQQLWCRPVCLPLPQQVTSSRYYDQINYLNPGLDGSDLRTEKKTGDSCEDVENFVEIGSSGILCTLHNEESVSCCKLITMK